jgi:tetratricopeptide (TPR) repeat protein
MKDATDAFSANDNTGAVTAYRMAVTMRPASPDALQGLAGALMKSGDAAGAAPVLEKLLELQPSSEFGWKQLVSARFDAGGAEQALATSRRIPQAVRDTLGRDVEHLALLAAAYANLGQMAESKKFLSDAVELANSRGVRLTAPLELRFAGLFLRHKHARAAATVFERVTQSTPSSIEAWEGLLAALVEDGQPARAQRAAKKAPADAYEAGLRRPGFLRSLASIYLALDNAEEAEHFLQLYLRHAPDPDAPDAVDARLQLAQLWLARKQPEKAGELLRPLSVSHPENTGVRKALVAALHHAGRDREALQEDIRLPAAVSVETRSDPDYVALLAACENDIGNHREAMSLVRRAIGLLQQQRRPVPAALEIQFAWLLLETQGDQHELYSVLQRSGARPDLRPGDVASLGQIWASWAFRRSEAAMAAGDRVQAVAILHGAVRMLPRDTSLRSALAGALLDNGERKKALRVYTEWGLTGATVADFSGAISAATDEGDDKLATLWLELARKRWPDNPQLLVLAGRRAAAARNYRDAERYWRAALVSMPNDGGLGQAGPSNPFGNETNPAETMRDLLLGPGTAPKAPARSDVPIPSLSPAPKVPSGTNAPVLREQVSRPIDVWRPRIEFVSQNLPQRDPDAPRVLPRFEDFSQPIPDSVSPSAPGLTRRAAPHADDRDSVLPVPPGLAPGTGTFLDRETRRTSLRDELETQLQSIEARDTPFLGTGGSIRGRSGEDGFEKLILQEAEMEASTVIAGRIRLAAIARPTYLDAGTPDGQSSRRFGLLPSGSTFGAQSVGGVAGEVQISTETFGLRFGSTPRSFLVSNFIGGVRFRPGNGPITLIAERDVLRDSMLSFAGVRDPISNLVWGGVVANSIQARGQWGTEASGFYASLGFQHITGTQVQKNQRVDGNAGVYWRVLNRETSSLTAGFNLSGMHYERNLRFFTLGHGGYFSPQKYFLFNVPVRWRGTYRQLEFNVSGTLGSQHFQEEASPFFPTLPGIQGRNGSFYPLRSATGANYGLEARVARQITPDWYVGGWLNFNNARDYNAQAAGIFIKYSFRERPLQGESNIPSVPDWRGVEPFRLQ